MDKLNPRDLVVLTSCERDMLSNRVKYKLDARWLVIFLLLEMRVFDKLESKLEIVMEKRMHDTCQHRYGL